MVSVTEQQLASRAVRSRRRRFRQILVLMEGAPDAFQQGAPEGLAALARAREELENQIASEVAAARTNGTTWAQIATALGMASRQAAEMRYGRKPVEVIHYDENGGVTATETVARTELLARKAALHRREGVK